MADFRAAVQGFAALDHEALSRPWAWRDGTIDVRYALYRALEEAQEAHVRVAAEPHPESRRILALAQRAFGDLRGLLAGLPAERLDAAPRPGEWSIRETLHHLLVVERRYALQTLYAVERTDADPVRIPDARLPTPAQLDAGGDADALLARLADARAETNRRLGDLTPAAMARPTVWVKIDLDVRFRLHRFASHLVEHTVQCEKTLDALGWRASEGRQIVRRVTAALGELDGLGARAAARDIESRLAGRLASVTAALAAG
jgi:DinB family protein